MVKLLDIPETITYSLSNVKLILVTNNYFVEINEVIKGLRKATEFMRWGTAYSEGRKILDLTKNILTL